MSNTRREPHITLAFRLAYASNRNYLKGIAKYLHTRRSWNVRILTTQEDFSPDELADPSTDGIITVRPRSQQIEAAMDASCTPLVIIGSQGEWFRKRKSLYTIVHCDDKDIGTNGFNYLQSLGKFRSFGFIGSGPGIYWSAHREEGFKSAARQAKNAVRIFHPKSIEINADDTDALSKWLQALPKPAAVMAAYDEIAAKALAICKSLGIDIPRQLALLGVDNDEILCEFSKPTLSSIAPDAVRLGELAAQELAALLRSKQKAKAKFILTRNQYLIERDSTKPTPPATHILNDAIKFIADNADKDIRVPDVVSHLRISRPLADRIFHTYYKRTILETISHARINHLKRQLRISDQPICKITAACGFKSANYAKRLFRNLTGISMSDWRKHVANGNKRNN